MRRGSKTWRKLARAASPGKPKKGWSFVVGPSSLVLGPWTIVSAPRS
jgi:hypothetical protein